MSQIWQTKTTKIEAGNAFQIGVIPIVGLIAYMLYFFILCNIYIIFDFVRFRFDNNNK